eukprot:TRINITY_DN0_c1217_g1_i4.p1 TRINITY_DN0_c1217_g1~~TRINITY_DN0_c1217_g1_i4.p1  ORF type:complete len:106 (+),score=26.47 TRINITY_DN0_c1217_g1_i4:27-344(+)
MLSKIGLVLLLHAGYSLSGYRHFKLLKNDQDFSIPLDILLQIAVGAVLCLFFGIISDQPFKKLREFKNNVLYDSFNNNANFKDVYHNRGKLLKKYFIDTKGLNFK